MVIITPAEFRADQKKFFDMAEKETVIANRKNKKPSLLNLGKKTIFPRAKNLWLFRKASTIFEKAESRL